MAYLRCIKCGNKALVAASQCPKCAHPFNLLDARGQRAKLKQCRSCGIMHRADAHCHWCGEAKGGVSLPRIDAAVMRSAAGVALMLTAAGGAWRFAPQLRDAVATASAAVSANDPVTNTVASASASLSGSGRPVSMAVGMPSQPALVADSALAQATATPMADSLAGVVTSVGEGEIRWVPAVARTWVNVRADASRGGQVVGVIKPASRAMLGTDRAGWRQVRSPDVNGWVDPRLFEPDSLRTRGE